MADTIDQTWRPDDGQPRKDPVPGVVVVFTTGRPVLAAVPLVDGELVVGRGALGAAQLDDPTVSKRHAKVAFDGNAWEVRDLGSRNGTAVDGVPLTRVHRGAATVVRVGDTLLLPKADLGVLAGGVVATVANIIVGPTSAVVRDLVTRAAEDGVVHLRGPSGSGKEHLARLFHDAGPKRRGPFVAVNCAAIPTAVAERELFGSKRGAYSGAEDSEGHLVAADGGTLFLDEIGELGLDVQAKLLRAIETRQVTPLGTARAKSVSFGLVTATHRDLRADVAAERFRADLYYRLGVPEVVVPALAERREEIAWLVVAALARTSRRAHVSLVEACLVRAWPGNVRELLAAVVDAGRVSSDERVAARELAPSAGQAVQVDAVETGTDRERIVAALASANGNVTAAARALGVHRTQLRRWIDRLGLRASDEG